MTGVITLAELDVVLVLDRREEVVVVKLETPDAETELELTEKVDALRLGLLDV